MPDPAFSSLVDWCVVWQKVDTKTKYGQPRVGSPVNVKCRWLVNDQSSLAQDATQESYSRSIPLAKEVLLGSYVWGPGKIEDLPGSPQYYEVIGVQKISDVKGRHPHYRASLQKASKTLPALA